MLFEHWGDNRSFKTGGNAMFAWLAYCNGKTVYCNCPLNPITHDYNHILNFEHKHINASELFDKGIELQDCYIMTDQGETAGLDSLHPTKEVKDAYYFGLQATKLGVDWHFDTVRHKSIVNRLRLNIHFQIESIRYPPDPRKPLLAVKLKIRNRYRDISKYRSLIIMHPEKLFPLFNSDVLISPKQRIPESNLPNIDQIHRQLVNA